MAVDTFEFGEISHHLGLLEAEIPTTGYRVPDPNFVLRCRRKEHDTTPLYRVNLRKGG